MQLCNVTFLYFSKELIEWVDIKLKKKKQCSRNILRNILIFLIRNVRNYFS